MPSDNEEEFVYEGNDTTYLWTVVTLSVLFRTPYIRQVTACLFMAYESSILKNILAWESSNPSNSEGLTLDIEKLFCILCFESPQPVPGLLAISLQLPGDAVNTEKGHPSQLHDAKTSVSKPIPFYTIPVEDLPQCPYSTSLLLKYLGPRKLVDVLCCVLSEARILFHSKNLSVLPIVCEALRTLIYPLKWTHVYLPVIPIQLLNLIEAPVPFMLGIHSNWLKFINIDYITDIVIVDCDNGTIEKGTASVLSFPVMEDRWLVMSLKMILDSYYRSDDDFFGNLKNNYSLNCSESDVQIQLIIFDVVFHLLRFVPDCLFYLNPQCPVFNRQLFISEYATVEYTAFLEHLTITNSFHQLTESIHKPTTTFYYSCIERFNSEEITMSQSVKSIVKDNDDDQDSSIKSDRNSDKCSENGHGTPKTKQQSRPSSILFTRKNLPMATIIYDKIMGQSALTPSRTASRNRSYSDDFEEEVLSPTINKSFTFNANSVSTVRKSILKSKSMRNIHTNQEKNQPLIIEKEGNIEFMRQYYNYLPQWILESIDNVIPKNINSILLNRVNLYLSHISWASSKLSSSSENIILNKICNIFILFIEFLSEKSSPSKKSKLYTLVSDI